ncbi:hypothetical protein [Saccharibacillus deserti]|uniref:hypothetical protein n=1 Tax=Saccharibacillus deserti TaxID=1634444 RepID=UPI001555ED5C|nr:hypothetical protein [Saccharibacillus deserti]
MTYGLPLPDSGFLIEVGPGGFVSSLCFFGRCPEPSPPALLRTPDEVLQEFGSGLELTLGIHFLHKQTFAEGDDRLHLVYRAEPYPSLRSAEYGIEPSGRRPFSPSPPSVHPASEPTGFENALAFAHWHDPDFAPFTPYARSPYGRRSEIRPARAASMSCVIGWKIGTPAGSFSASTLRPAGS